MLSTWPIRRKLLVGLGLLLVMVATLSASGTYGLYSYRGLVKTLSGRSTEFPLAAELSHQVSDLRVTLSEVRGRLEFPSPFEGRASLDNQLLRERFRLKVAAIRDTLERYSDQLDENVHRPDWRIAEDRQERETLAEICQTLDRVDAAWQDRDWMLDELKTGRLASEIEELNRQAAELPAHLRRRLQALALGVRAEYRTAIVLTWCATGAAGLTFVILLRLFYAWVFRPLRVLVHGSRQVAQGNFDHRIQLETRDEMRELAEAMNDMTDRFRTIRDDLDRQVRQRTREVVRSEQLASVGFLAAGVAHEINNPLASIAFSAESLESRMGEWFAGEDEGAAIFRNYLRMIQTEAFRCKEITEKLLNFSRMGDRQHQPTELRTLVQDVIDMLQHMGRYKGKRIEFCPGQPVVADVCPHEMKQVILNLITNGLDSLDADGTVTVEVVRRGDQVEMSFSDDGCGMSDEVLQHLFEPFFTRRRGGHGTGLGLSITYRIIADHEGHIDASSEGPGKGARFIVTLPACEKTQQKEKEHRYQAA